MRRFTSFLGFAVMLWPAISLCADLSRLHENISNRERYEILSFVVVGDILSAPGHRNVRNPGGILEIAEVLKATRGQGLPAWSANPIVLNAFTSQHAGIIRIASIEVVDGNHRLLGGIHSGEWKTLSDIPQSIVEIRVNGRRSHGGGIPPHWIPLATARRSQIHGWRDVSNSFGARGPSAEIPGDIPSNDPRFAEEDRGIPLRQVLKQNL